jgi:hypothetical protein
MKQRLVILAALIFAFFSFAPSVFAAATPSFSSCTSPQGSQIAGFDDGTHGVLGFDSLQPGSDHVYSNSNGAEQCFCNGSSGVQTNWWQIDPGMSLSEIDIYVKQGWTYVPDGSAWGLNAGPYLAKNVSFSCSGGGGSSGGGGGVLGSSTSDGGGSNTHLYVQIKLQVVLQCSSRLSVMVQTVSLYIGKKLPIQSVTT